MTSLVGNSAQWLPSRTNREDLRWCSGPYDNERDTEIGTPVATRACVFLFLPFLSSSLSSSSSSALVPVSLGQKSNTVESTPPFLSFFPSSFRLFLLRLSLLLHRFSRPFSSLLLSPLYFALTFLVFYFFVFFFLSPLSQHNPYIN